MAMRNPPNAVIAGAGIVGLAAAYQLLKMKPDLKVAVLEKESRIALHQTGRNSGVVHTGVYYKPGSLKALNCIAGRRELLAFASEESIRCRQIHKLIVATRSEETPFLRELLARGQANGIPGIRLISKEEAKEIEPAVNALEALYIPECHIIDYKEVSEALARRIRQAGGEIIFDTEVIGAEGSSVRCKGKEFPADVFINCAGLHSDRLARATDLKILPFRGEYYELAPEKRAVVRGLIYPVPDPKFPFLGVHLTPMVNGKVEAGPNAVLAWAREGYKKTDFNVRDLKEIFSYAGFWNMASKYWRAGCYEMLRSFSKKLFLRDLQRLVPSIEEKDLAQGGVGIRAQAVKRSGALVDDFAFHEEGRAIHVLNAPSPAATASFSIGRTIANKAMTKV